MSSSPAPAAPRGKEPRSRAAKATGGIAGIDLVVWLILANLIDDHGALILVAAFTIGLPAVLASSWVERCSAWNRDGDKRCKNKRPGFMARCQHHNGVAFTTYDWAAAMASFVAIFNALVLMWLLLQR